MESTRVAVYSRVSTRDKGQDTENQMRQLREFCQRQGYVIAREYVDHASGKRSDREAFVEMFSAASRHEFDVVIFWVILPPTIFRPADFGEAHRTTRPILEPM